MVQYKFSQKTIVCAAQSSTYHQYEEKSTNLVEQI